MILYNLVYNYLKTPIATSGEGSGASVVVVVGVDFWRGSGRMMITCLGFDRPFSVNVVYGCEMSTFTENTHYINILRQITPPSSGHEIPVNIHWPA
jgi:hypothetical protein